MDDDLPRPRGDAASLLAKEDLSPYSQDELAERIALLETEIARVESHRLRRRRIAALLKSCSASHRHDRDGLAFTGPDPISIASPFIGPALYRT